MVIKSLMRLIHLKVFFIVLLTAATTLVSANEDPRNVRFYGHIGGGIGIGFFQSSDIENVLPGLTIINVGFPISGVLRAGYSNIIQVEYRKLFAGADHTMETENQFSTTQIEIDTEFDQDDILFKINPLVGGYHSDRSPFFIVLGMGNVEYKDDLGDGFEGNSKTIGVEWASFKNKSRFLTTYGLKYISTDFDGGTIPALTGETFKATDYVFDVTFSVGFSM